MAKWTRNLRSTKSAHVKGKTMNYLQQGDVLLHAESIPQGKMTETHDPILQYGEHTGHKHKLMFMHGEGHGSKPVQSCFRVLTDKATGTRYLKVDEPADLVHEEHKTIAVPPGEYRIGIVKEYDHFKEEAREVID